MNNAIENIQSADNSVIKFLDYHKDRVRHKELAASTLKNYYRAAKLFCEMNDLTLNWKKIARGYHELKIHLMIELLQGLRPKKYQIGQIAIVNSVKHSD